jgi:hypothetical protein
MERGQHKGRMIWRFGSYNRSCKPIPRILLLVIGLAKSKNEPKKILKGTKERNGDSHLGDD